MTPSSQKTDLLTAIQEQRAALEELLAELTQAEMVLPGVEGEWSVKDILAHLAAWQEYTLYRLEAALAGRFPEKPPLQGWEEIHAQNQQYFETYRSLSLGEVLYAFRSTYARMVAKVEALDEAFIASKLPEEWFGGRAVHALITANTCWHDAEHTEAIEKWMEYLP